MTLILDRSKAFSECRGERQPDDPHYRVHFWQGQMLGKDMVLLPFDCDGNLIPDDGKTEPYEGLVEGKPVKHFPLYTPKMRALVERKTKRLAAAAPGEEGDEDGGERDTGPTVEDVNFAAWLQGTRYEWQLLQKAFKARYHVANPSKRDMVWDLVHDHHVVPAEKVCPDLAVYLKEAA